LHAVRTPRLSNEREEEKGNGKESEETREEIPDKAAHDGQVVSLQHSRICKPKTPRLHVAALLSMPSVIAPRLLP
jgi:hypothetical protein